MVTFTLQTVSRNNKFGFVNSKGKEVIPVKYDKMVKRFYNSKGEVVLKKNISSPDLDLL